MRFIILFTHSMYVSESQVSKKYFCNWYKISSNANNIQKLNLPHWLVHPILNLYMYLCISPSLSKFMQACHSCFCLLYCGIANNKSTLGRLFIWRERSYPQTEAECQHCHLVVAVSFQIKYAAAQCQHSNTKQTLTMTRTMQNIARILLSLLHQTRDWCQRFLFWTSLIWLIWTFGFFLYCCRYCFRNDLPDLC